MKADRKTLFLVFLIFIGKTLISCGQVTITVNEIPENTPDDATIYIAGNFNSWNPGDNNFTLEKQNDNTYKIVIPEGNGTLEYKFTRGDWNTVEGDAEGGELPNRTFTFGNNQSIITQILTWKDLENNSNSGNSTAAENVHIVSETFEIPQLNRTRRVWVYLPPDYETSTKNYPVIYMHDGQNLFDAATSFSGEWEIDESLNKLFNEGGFGSIIIGIDNGQQHRINEYSPWINSEFGGGEGDLYGKFLVETLKPYIDSNYRTLKERENTGIIGSSMGGLISFYLGLKYQNTFGRIGVFSPSFWFTEDAYTFAQNHIKQESTRIYFLGGELESPTLSDEIERMFNILKSVGYTNAEMKFVMKEDGKHSEWFWKRDFPNAYKWLYQETSNVTALIQESKNDWIKVFPNPFESSLFLKSESPFKETLYIKVYDVNGKLIKSQKVKSQKRMKSFILNSKKWQKGKYLISLRMGEESYSKRVVKL